MENGRCFKDPASGVRGVADSLYLTLRKQGVGKDINHDTEEGLGVVVGRTSEKKN
jgi:hypothetical protein